MAVDAGVVTKEGGLQIFVLEDLEVSGGTLPGDLLLFF